MVPTENFPFLCFLSSKAPQNTSSLLSPVSHLSFFIHWTRQQHWTWWSPLLPTFWNPFLQGLTALLPQRLLLLSLICCVLLIGGDCLTSKQKCWVEQTTPFYFTHKHLPQCLFAHSWTGQVHSRLRTLYLLSYQLRTLFL